MSRRLSRLVEQKQESRQYCAKQSVAIAQGLRKERTSCESYSPEIASAGLRIHGDTATKCRVREAYRF